MNLTRRSALNLASFGAVAGVVPAAVTGHGGRIDRLEIFRVHVNHRGDWVLFRITTSDGVTGIGDASHGRRDAGVIAEAERLFERLKQLGAWNLEEFRRQSFPELQKSGLDSVVAFSGLEQCCWDIRGKILNRPVYDLMGGRIHADVRNYANINRAAANRDPKTFGDLAGRAAAAGFDAIKLASFDGMPKTDAERIRQHTERGVACIAEVRRAVGGKADIFVDGHSNFSVQGAIDVMKQLEPQRLAWLEEMTPETASLAAFNKVCDLPTAGGEELFGVKGFFPYLAAGAVDIAMPDIKYCGGAFELKKIAALAESAGLECSPHGPASPVGNMAAAHVCVTMPNFYILEMAFGENPWRAELIDPPEQVVKGRINPSPRPGYGIELNDKTLSKYKAV